MMSRHFVMPRLRRYIVHESVYIRGFNKSTDLAISFTSPGIVTRTANGVLRIPGKPQYVFLIQCQRALWLPVSLYNAMNNFPPDATRACAFSIASQRLPV